MMQKFLKRIRIANDLVWYVKDCWWHWFRTQTGTFLMTVTLCQNHLTIWYMTSEDEIQTAGSSDPLVLASAILTRSYCSGSDPLEFVKTLKTVPSTTAQKSPSKLPKMSFKMNVGQVMLHHKDLATLNSRQWLNDLVVHAYFRVLAAAYNTEHAKGCLHSSLPSSNFVGEKPTFYLVTYQDSSWWVRVCNASSV